MTPKDPMARDFRELCKDSTHERTPHPSIEQLALYLRRELAPEQQEILRDHLTTCSPCQRELLDLHSFRDLVAESRQRADLGRCPPGLPEESNAYCKTEVERVWDELWQSLSEGSQPKGIVNGSLWPQWNVAFGWTRISIVFLLTASLTWTSLLLGSLRHDAAGSSESPACSMTLVEGCVPSASCFEQGTSPFWQPWVQAFVAAQGARSKSLDWLWSDRSRPASRVGGRGQGEMHLVGCDPDTSCFGWQPWPIRGVPKAAKCEEHAGAR